MAQLAQAARAFDHVASFGVFHHEILQATKPVIAQVVPAQAGERRQLDEDSFHLFKYTQIAFVSQGPIMPPHIGLAIQH